MALECKIIYAFYWLIAVNLTQFSVILFKNSNIF